MRFVLVESQICNAAVIWYVARPRGCQLFRFPLGLQVLTPAARAVLRETRRGHGSRRGGVPLTTPRRRVDVLTQDRA